MADSPGASAEGRLGPEFHRFWLAAAASNLGDGIRLGALPLLAYSLTDDARLIALVSAATLLPWFVFGPLGGALVDRHDRRRLMIGGQIGRAACGAGLVALIATDTVTIWWVVAIAFALGVGEMVVDSCSQAAVPQLVEPDQLDRANGRLIAAITVLDQVVGVAVGAALFAIAADLPFAVDVATFVVGAVVLTTIRRPLQDDRDTVTTVRTDIAEGMRFLFGHHLLRGLMAAVAVSNLAGNMAFGVLVILVVDEIGAAEATFGIVLATGAIGGVLGSLVASSLTEQLGRARVLSTMPVLLTGAYVINAFAVAPWMVSVSFFIASFSIVVFNVPGQSIRQSVTPEHLLGRVVASFRMIGMGAAPAGAIIGGFVAEAADVRVANGLAAGVGVLAWLLVVLSLRHLDDTSPAP